MSAPQTYAPGQRLRDMSDTPPTTITGLRLRLLVINAHRLLWKQYRRSPLWALVVDLFGVGSTTAAAICREVGVDPHQLCGAQRLAEIPPA